MQTREERDMKQQLKCLEFILQNCYIGHSKILLQAIHNQPALDKQTQSNEIKEDIKSCYIIGDNYVRDTGKH